ncbi:hypothetical protein CSUB01_06134 [Colletotrichum sublineola]|uniref:Uncharacterized protein n=1 Tax=Colletotrichum sublineola TaxID=1173701 RepID=A0A066XB35_COLSU|nr:hypothetical protein CSUB01_06134 [Colletotrichum sublineola]
MDCSRLFECLLGQLPQPQQTITEKQAGVVVDQPVRSAQEAASEFVDILRTAEKDGKDLERSLRNVVTANSWTGEIAKYILQGVESLVRHRDTVGQVVREATDKAADAAQSIFDFAADHPVFVTVVAIGVLVAVAPWVLEALGFSELGPVATSRDGLEMTSSSDMDDGAGEG